MCEHNITTICTLYVYVVQVSPYAEYLYDAVSLYAQALDEVLRQGGNVKDGRDIVDLIRGRTYFS